MLRALIILCAFVIFVGCVLAGIGYLVDPNLCGQSCNIQHLDYVRLERVGGAAFWDWLRRDDGKGYWFLFLQSVVFTGLYWLWNTLQRLRIDVKDSVSYVKISAELAKSGVSAFFDGFDVVRKHAENAGDTNEKSWRSAGQPPLGDLYNEAVERLIRLESDTRAEGRVWKLAGKNYPVFEDYRKFVGDFLNRFQNFKRHKYIHTLEPLVQSSRENMKQFVDYDFALSNQVPTLKIS